MTSKKAGQKVLDFSILVLGYKEIFKEDGGGVERVRNSLKGLNLHAVLQFCAKFSLFLYAIGKANMKEQGQLIKTFFPEKFKEKLIKALEKHTEPIDTVILFHEQALLLLVKEALINCPPEGGIEVDNEMAQELGYCLLILTNECLGWDTDNVIERPKSFVAERVRRSFAQYGFFSTDEYYPELMVRFNSIFSKARELALRRNVDIDKLFCDATNGITLESYHALTLGLLSSWFKNLNKTGVELDVVLGNEWLVCKNKFFSQTKVKSGQIDKILSFLSICPGKFAEHYESLVNDVFQGKDCYNYNFLAFIKKPFIIYPNNCFICPSPRYLINRATEGVYWIIHDYIKGNIHLPLALSDWSEIWGTAFEDYVNNAFAEIFNNNFIPNPVYKGIERGDGVINADSFTGMIETKYVHWKYKTKVTGDKDLMKKELKEKLMRGGPSESKGLGQIRNNIAAYLDNKYDFPFKPHPIFLPVLIVGEHMPLFPCNRKFYEEIMQEEQIVFEKEFTSPFIILEAEDIQVLKSYARKHGRKATENIILEYSNLFREKKQGYSHKALNFKNFVFAKTSGALYKDDQVLHDEFEQLFTAAKELLFGKK
ncbi:hypothetical protein KKB83_05005 [Patescibacteria group bacterium]|nr:hypothetical protein [Patescibacteria group bacterium]